MAEPVDGVTEAATAFDQMLDARDLRCPLPVLKAEKRLAALPPGAVLTVLATDPMAKIDLPLYCRQHGHACDVETRPDGVLAFRIVRGPRS